MQKFNSSLIRQFPSLITGNAAAGVQISVFIAGGNTPAKLYATNNTAGAQLSNPLTTDSKGFYSFYAADGQYRLQFSNGYPALEIQLLDAVQWVSDTSSGAGLLGQAASAAVQSINEANAQVQQSLDSLLTSGWFVVGDFADGVTFTARNQVARDSSGEFWSYNGSLPFTVPAGTVPSAPAYTNRGDAALRSALAAADSTVLVGGVEAGKITKRVATIISASEYGLSSSESAANNMQAIKNAIAETPIGGFLLIPDDGGVYTVDTTGGLSSAAEINKRISVIINGTLQANFSAVQLNPPFIFNVTSDDVTMSGSGKLIGDGTVDQTNTGDHTDTPGLVYVTGNSFKSNLTIERPPKAGYSFVGSLGSEIMGAKLVGGATTYLGTAYFAIRAFQSHGLKIKDNTIEQDASGGKFVSLAFLVDCDDVQYKDNRDNNALFEKHIYLLGDNATISGNKTKSVTVTAPFRTHGFNNKIFGNSSDGCAGGIQAYGSIITDNNRFLNCTQAGIAVYGDSTYDCSNTVIGEDTVTGSLGNVENLIRVFTDGADANNVKILGATADSLAGIATFRPVSIEAGLGHQVTNARISDVTTNGGQYGILLTRVNGGKVKNNKTSNTTSSPWAETGCSDVEWLDNSARDCALNEIQGLSASSRGSGNTYSDAGLSGVVTMIAATSTALGRNDIAPNAKVFIAPANDSGGVQQVTTGLKTQVAAGDVIFSTCNGVAATAGAQLHYLIDQ